VRKLDVQHAAATLNHPTEEDHLGALPVGGADRPSADVHLGRCNRSRD
jgi:hypothetical protein